VHKKINEIVNPISIPTNKKTKLIIVHNVDSNTGNEQSIDAQPKLQTHSPLLLQYPLTLGLFKFIYLH
jgi:hypothetical protein